MLANDVASVRKHQGKEPFVKSTTAMGLRANDRWEPSPQMADVMQLERLIELPVIVLIWRSPEHPVVHLRHPLLGA